MSEPVYRQLALGVPAPWFRQRTISNPGFVFHTVGGRYIVLGFFGSAAEPTGQRALEFIRHKRSAFDDEQLSFFGVSVDPADETESRVQQSVPGIRFIWDFDRAVSRLYGAAPESGEGPYRHRWVVLNPGMQVVAVLPFREDGSERRVLAAFLSKLPAVSHYGGVEMHAPVIILPDVFDQALCRRLIEVYEAGGASPTGFMRDVDGKTVMLHDPGHKKRTDLILEDPELCRLLQRRVYATVVPVIQKVHCFQATHMERYLVGCYDSESGGHFAPHRDNTTLGTAHRRFALSVNLNDDFEGGELSFPEYGPRVYKVPAGSAIVFSGSLLHKVTPVRQGRRFAFLPFLYDHAAAELRKSNLQYLAAGLGESDTAPGEGAPAPAGMKT